MLIKMVKIQGILAVLLVVLQGCEPVVHYFGMQDDSLPEEVIEAAIKYETNVDIDLTPSSPE